MKTFGNHAKRVPRERFKLLYQDAHEQPCEFEGSILLRSSGGDLAQLLKQVKAQSEDSVNTVVKMLTKVMDDTDGVVTSSWELQEFHQPDDLDEDERAEWEPSYKGPDGNLYPFSDRASLAKWSDHAQWTTRRRWIELMEKDDDAVVDLADLMEIMEWQMGLAAERPTRPRA